MLLRTALVSFLAFATACDEPTTMDLDLSTGDFANADVSSAMDDLSAAGDLSSIDLTNLAGDGGATLFNESEPNNGAAANEVNAITWPAIVSGAIGAADDIDLFTISLTAGDRLTVTVHASGSLQAHVAIFADIALGVPNVVGAPSGNDATGEFYALKTGTYLLAVRDRRNVGGTPSHVGGAGFDYTMNVDSLTRAPISGTIGTDQMAMLSPRGIVQVFSFSAVANDNLEIKVVAHQLMTPSSVDSRLSLFYPGSGAWLGTNDDVSLGETDSLLAGPVPFTGTYHAIVENVSESGSDYNFTLKITKK